MAFSQQGPRAVCILSANGAVSNVTLRQPSSSGGTVTYEVEHFIIVMYIHSWIHDIFSFTYVVHKYLWLVACGLVCLAIIASFKDFEWIFFKYAWLPLVVDLHFLNLFFTQPFIISSNFFCPNNFNHWYTLSL